MSDKIINAKRMTELLKKHHFKGIKEALAEAPEVVRCADCRYCHNSLDADNRAYLACEMWDDLDTMGDWFCSRGERW